jgi:5'-nucleotidase
MRNAVIAGGGIVALGGGGALWMEENGTIRITILHTNDVHSRIDPFPATDPKFPNMGGFARRASMVRLIRQQEPHVLLLDSGDIFQGTPYFNYYGGELEFRLMSQMGYDAATLGNHDFDNGIDGLVKQLPHATFPFISSNYDVSGTALEGHVEPYRIFERGGIRIGVYGLGVELEGLVNPKLFGEIRYLDPLQTANKMGTQLKREMGCDIVICLSHLGFSYESPKVSDMVIAQYSHSTDVILGGHTHTLLETPEVVQNIEGKQVIICQTGHSGVRLGRVDLEIDRLTKIFRPAYIALKVLKNQ